jgi:putative transposase
MRAPYSQLYLHCIWATWDRMPFLTPDIEQQEFAAMSAKSQELKYEAIAIGGNARTHSPVGPLHPTVAVADLMKEVKGAFSQLVTQCIKIG